MVNREKRYEEGKPIPAYKRQKIGENKEEKKEPQQKDQEPKDNPWLYKGIIVKVMQKELGGGKFYKQKGKVYKIRMN